MNIDLSAKDLERIFDLAWERAQYVNDINERVEAKRVCRKFAKAIARSKSSRWKVNL